MIGAGIAARSLHGAGVCLIPRPENNYAPLVLRRGPLAAVSALLVTAKLLALGLVALTPVPAELSTITNARIVQLTNVERAQAGLSDLTVSDTLTEAARLKAEDMLANDYFAHISPAGVTPWFWMQKVGYTYQVAGENLAIDFVEAEDVVAAWMASPSHRDNILQSDYIQTGVAVLTGEYQGGTSTVVVHMFGLPHDVPAPSSTAPVSASLGARAAQPVASPAPTPTVVPEAEPPASPTVQLVDPQEVVQREVVVRLTSEAGVVVHLSINDVEQAMVAVPSDAAVEHTLSVADLPDGELRVTAVAVDEAGQRSVLSAPVTVLKDTQGPAIEREQLVFVASPATDRPQLVLVAPAGSYASVVVAADGETALQAMLPGSWVPFSLGASDVAVTFYDTAGNATTLGNLALRPSLYTDRDTTYLAPPATFSMMIRRVALVAMALILLLLLGAVLIHVRVQRPRMIAHASLVILLAAIVFFL